MRSPPAEGKQQRAEGATFHLKGPLPPVGCVSSPATILNKPCFARNGMSLSTKELNRLRRIVSIAQKLIAEAPAPRRGRPSGSKIRKTKRVRRTGKELVEFRRMLKAQRKRGTPVAALARQHGVSSAYIYMI